ncbi:Redox-sensing transcriptional repressor rex [Sulfobacillus acidophilus DSM 10332]|uniref:Redox-sensing transcriptional repressor Rex n=1 Tax=Sulfobacillus acidophilus (strain ATCC 700253 / DSM 10332 / NAL) TaxID=679936 RepID=G8TYH3_SULAD|nr:Redox-sensing transcriptional repressor rex [Sulfobacillus acidophilus DSM 10332]MCY0864871.1 redox-sensing transcriptional repressor Rex [Sulfobacillus sp.]
MERYDAKTRRIPETTIRRLPAYLRALSMTNEDRMTSDALGVAAGYSSEQVRKDLAYFGAFGTRGVGYDVELLREEIRRILQLDQGVRAVVIGAGRLGTALVRHASETHSDVVIAAVLDIDPRIIGRELDHLRVEPLDRLEAVVDERDIGMGIIAVPPSGAQAVLDRLVQAGVRAILNFAPTSLTVGDPQVFVQHIDLTLEMQALAYFVGPRERTRS